MTQVVFPQAPSVRFAPEPHTQALLCLEPDQANFQADITAEVKNESYSGCSLSLPRTDWLSRGDTVQCKVGNLAPVLASIIWCRNAGPDRTEVGLRYES